jgi:hypothetical protein
VAASARIAGLTGGLRGEAGNTTVTLAMTANGAK